VDEMFARTERGKIKREVERMTDIINSSTLPANATAGKRPNKSWPTLRLETYPPASDGAYTRIRKTTGEP
jgi:hypothetical protein